MPAYAGMENTEIFALSVCMKVIGVLALSRAFSV
jgi:hypothetical protein